MTKRCSILQKKLKELESILYQLLSLPPETPFNHQLYAQDIDQRFEFVRKLLSAEIASHPKKPYHLQHIARRLTELEAIFKEWDSLKALTVLDHFEPVSTCSCRESCLDNEGDEGDAEVSPELGSPGLEEAQKFYQGLVEEEQVHGVEEKEIGADDDEAAEKDVKREDKRICVVGKYVGVMAVGIMLGMAFTGLIMARFSGCFNCVKDSNFLLTPT